MSGSSPGFGHNPKPLLIVISGPSGVGKDSVVQHMKQRGIEFHFVVTATSRPARKNEVHGVDYYFYSAEEFERMVQEDEFLEHAKVYDDYKGVPRTQAREALASGHDVVMRLDVQGAATIRKKIPGAVLIFLTTDTEDELIQRLIDRKTDTAEDIELRVKTAREEYRRLNEFNYVVVNRDGRLDETVETIRAILIAEQHRVDQREVTL